MMFEQLFRKLKSDLGLIMDKLIEAPGVTVACA